MMIPSVRMGRSNSEKPGGWAKAIPPSRAKPILESQSRPVVFIAHEQGWLLKQNHLCGG